MVQQAAKQGTRADPPFRSIPRGSATLQVREQLLEAIQSGQYVPGELLPSERVLCGMFGVSRVSVREAIAGLIAMGVVSSQQGRGCFVREQTSSLGYSAQFASWLSLHRDELITLLDVRGALDELAAFQAVERSDARSLRKIGSTHESFQREASLSVPNVERLVAKDVAFHRSIAQASGSELLVSLLDELADHITDSRRVTLVGRDARMSAKEHAAVVGAIERRDAPAAKEAAGAHVRSVRDWVEAALAEAPAL